MKRLMVVAVGTVVLMSGAAYAGGGCANGEHLASESAQSPVLAAVEDMDADQVKKLKAIEEQAKVDTLFEKPVVHN